MSIRITHVHRLTASFFDYYMLDAALLLMFLSLAVTVTAQTDQTAKHIAAEKLIVEFTQLYQIGTRDSLKEGIARLERTLPIYREGRDTRGEANALGNIANCYLVLGENEKALEYYNKALPLEKELGDRSAEAYVLVGIGRVYNKLGQNQRALDYGNQALLLQRTTGDAAGEALTLSNMADVYALLGENQKALASCNQAVELEKAIGDFKGEARTLTSMGNIHARLGAHRKALEYDNQALLLERAVGDRSNEAATLNSIGNVYNGMGENQKALEYFNQALPLMKTAEDRRGEAITINNSAMAYVTLGELQKALEEYNQALLLERAVGDRSSEAATLTNIGTIYQILGENQRALQSFNQAMLFFHAVGNLEDEARALNNIGIIYKALGENQRALAYYNQALPLHRAVGNQACQAGTLNNIGGIYSILGEDQQALKCFNQALILASSVRDQMDEELTLTNIGNSYLKLGDNQKALEYYNQALRLSREINDQAGEALTLYDVARLEGSRNDLIEARRQIEAALRIIESLWSRYTNSDLRTSYFATGQTYYKFYIDLLMQMHKQQPSEGFAAVALQASERARARGLLELLTEGHVDIRQGVDPELLQRERALQQQLNSKAEVRVRLLNGQHTADQAGSAAKEIEALTTDYQEVEAKIRQTSRHYAALTQPQPLDLMGIQAQLDADTLLLEYSLGMEHSYLWLVSPTEIKSFELPAPKEIEAAARSFYELLITSNRIYALSDEKQAVARALTDPQRQEMLETASHLSQMLIGPVASQLGKKRLVIVADGALQYLPFAALPDPTTIMQETGKTQPMIVQHEIVSLPSISSLATLRSELAGRKLPPKDLAVLADPVFDPDDERVKSSSTHRESSRRLKGTRKEADGIVAFVPANRAREALDFEANRELANSGELGQYRYIHFATHGLIDSIHPELSAIVLSLVDEKGNPRDGFLRANEAYNLSLSADVVVLSGCETGLGKEVKGEGLIGLTRGFMYAGAPRVVVSLWAVKDESTAKLMVSFYRNMIKEGKRPAEALRAAQIEMLKSERLRAPYYWAAFVLQGEWR